jgi:hypothetical protein
MSKHLTDDACKAIIKGIAKKFDIEAKLITTRLMSEEDKQDMREGNLPVPSLRLHVELWIKAGLPDYAHGKTTPLAEEARGNLSGS